MTISNVEILDVINFTATGVAGVVGWIVGRRKQKNDFLVELQSSIDLLIHKNKELLDEVILLRGENSELAIEVKELRNENHQLKIAIEKLTEELNKLKNKNK